MAGTAVAPVSTAITERARERFDAQQIELIRHTVAAECNAGELAIFLEECARYELDPFAKQIWAVKIQGRMQIIVSRDGLLALANRKPDFRGCKSYEIREHDYFSVTEDGDGHCLVEHRWLDKDGKLTHGGKDGQLRGDIIGAFAYVRREGHVDTQFMAYAAQYDKHQNVWKSHPTAMMVKVAEAMALRKAYSISGVLGEHEVEPEPTSLTRPGERPIEIDFGPDEELARRLKEAFEHLGYRHAKVRTLMRACQTQEDREDLYSRLREEAEADALVDAEVVDAA